MCTSPIFIRKSDGSYRRVPCGRCAECLAKYQNSWKSRLMFERLDHKTPTYFVTLTYSDEHMPYVLSDEEGIVGVSFSPVFLKDSAGEPTDTIKTYVKSYTVYRGSSLPSISLGQLLTPTVYHKDLQDWIKRCRLSTERSLGVNLKKDLNFAYFFTSEYGPKRLRPHYHGLLFGLDLKTVKEWCDDWTKHFGREKDAKFNVRIEEVRGDGAADYVSKYCSKGFYDHPFCSKQIDVSSRIFDARISSFKSQGFYYDRHFDRHYDEPSCPANYRCAPRVLDTFHLVSQGLGLRKGIEFVANTLGCSHLLTGVDFSSRQSLKTLKSNLYDFFVSHYSKSRFVSFSEAHSLFDLSCTTGSLHPTQLPSSIQEGCPRFTKCLLCGFDSLPLLTEEGALVIDRVRKFSVVGVGKNGESRSFTYNLPRYYEAYFLPEGCSLSLGYSVRLSSLADSRESKAIASFQSTGLSLPEAYRAFYQSESEDFIRRGRKSFKSFCTRMDAISNSSLDL